MVVVRENNEDLYVGAGGFTRKGTPRRWRSRRRSTPVRAWSGASGSPSSRRGPGGLGPFRGLSGRRGRPRAHPAGHTGRQDQRPDLRARPWMRAFTETSRDYPDIKCDYQHVDACCMRMVVSPEKFDVIVTTNMFGDIITDLGAVLQGGMGLAASANLNPDRTPPACSNPFTARAGHRRQGDRQPGGGHPVGGHDARTSEHGLRGRAGPPGGGPGARTLGRPGPLTWEGKRPRPKWDGRSGTHSDKTTARRTPRAGGRLTTPIRQSDRIGTDAPGFCPVLCDSQA